MNGHRRPSQKTRVLALLEAAGARGVRTNEFLAEHLPRFGARIYELRNEGYQINGTPDPRSQSGVVYVLVGRDSGWPIKPPRAKRQPKFEARLLALAEKFTDGSRLMITCRTKPAAPVTRWTIQAAPDNAFPDPDHVWIGATLEEALASAERSAR